MTLWRKFVRNNRDFTADQKEDHRQMASPTNFPHGNDPPGANGQEYAVG